MDNGVTQQTVMPQNRSAALFDCHSRLIMVKDKKRWFGLNIKKHMITGLHHFARTLSYTKQLPTIKFHYLPVFELLLWNHYIFDMWTNVPITCFLVRFDYSAMPVTTHQKRQCFQTLKIIFKMLYMAVSQRERSISFLPVPQKVRQPKAGAPDAWVVNSISCTFISMPLNILCFFHAPSVCCRCSGTAS